MFKKGGHCFEELLRSHGGNLKDNTHVQFAEMPNVVFRLACYDINLFIILCRYNASHQRLEVCLGLTHVPVELLTDEQREIARQTAMVQEQSREGEHISNASLEPRPSGSLNEFLKFGSQTMDCSLKLGCMRILYPKIVKYDDGKV